VLKDSNETLSQDEIQVLTILEQHAKESVDKIAKKCGFSRQKVWRIIKHLEAEKIIWGYGATTHTEEKGLYFTLLLTRSNTPLDDSMQKEVKTEKLDKHLPSRVIIENISMVHGGEWNAIVTFYAPDLITAKQVVTSLFERTDKYFVKKHLLLQILFPIRKNGFKNPHIEHLVDYI